MDDNEYSYKNFKVFIKNGTINIQDKNNSIFIGATDGQRFQVLKDAISYVNAMMTLEELKTQPQKEQER